VSFAAITLCCFSTNVYFCKHIFRPETFGYTLVNSRSVDLSAVKNRVAVFWVVTPCSDVLGSKRFGGGYCLLLQGEVGILSHHVV
jgi:hypothetical protein